jgi:hypothetical protein
MRNRRAALVVAGALAALFAATPAQAALAPPEVFGIARLGDLLVVSSIYASRTSVDMRGVWLDESIGCDQWRRIRVRAIVSRSTPGAELAQIRTRKKTRVVQNCSEGGPNTGFTLRPKGLGFACPDGRWRPGRYDFTTTTRHLASGLQAAATASWRIRRPC